MRRYLPAPFRPKLVKGRAVVGICLIRLKQVRPKGMPAFVGIRSENAAHRIAVEWLEGKKWHSGVYIPRRDTSSSLNAIAGGRIFPGVHHHAKFEVREQEGQYEVAFQSDDQTSLAIKAKETEDWNPNSIFENIDDASHFFEQGAVGYSPDKQQQTCDGLLLDTYTWEVSALSVQQVSSSFFENEKIFPKGSVSFDNALLMKNIKHDWKGLKNMDIMHYVKV